MADEKLMCHAADIGYFTQYFKSKRAKSLQSLKKSLLQTTLSVGRSKEKPDVDVVKVAQELQDFDRKYAEQNGLKEG